MKVIKWPDLVRVHQDRQWRGSWSKSRRRRKTTRTGFLLRAQRCRSRSWGRWWWWWWWSWWWWWWFLKRILLQAQHYTSQTGGESESLKGLLKFNSHIGCWSLAKVHRKISWTWTPNKSGWITSVKERCIWVRVRSCVIIMTIIIMDLLIKYLSKRKMHIRQGPTTAGLSFGWGLGEPTTTDQFGSDEDLLRP